MLLSFGFVAGSYLAAWDSIRPLGSASVLGPWREALAEASWVALTALLLLTGYVNNTRGVALNRALPYGYLAALAGCVILGVGFVAQRYWVVALGDHPGLDQLFSPPRLLEVAAAGVIVVAPLRSALARRQAVASFPVLISAGLLLSVLTFMTQFAHPAIDVLSARHQDPVVSPRWVGQDLGVIAICFQALLAGQVCLVLLRSFRLPFGGLTLVLAVNGALISFLKFHLEYVPVYLATGLVADIFVHYLRPGRGQPVVFRLFCAAIPTTFAGAILLAVQLTGGIGGTPRSLSGPSSSRACWAGCRAMWPSLSRRALRTRSRGLGRPAPWSATR